MRYPHSIVLLALLTSCGQPPTTTTITDEYIANPSIAQPIAIKEDVNQMEETQVNQELLDALKILLVQFGEYKDGDGAAKYHAVNIAKDAIAKAEQANERHRRR